MILLGEAPALALAVVSITLIEVLTSIISPRRLLEVSDYD